MFYGFISQKTDGATAFLGVGGLIFVPIFKSITHLPPFIGILLVLGVLWTVTEVFYRHLSETNEKGCMQKRVTNMLSRIDMSTILFFLGILMAVAALEEIGARPGRFYLRSAATGVGEMICRQ